jgi:hypothetical protein
MSHGYGRFRYEGADQRAHRVAFRLTHGHWPVPCGLHTCDNTPCCNPAHLYEGTMADNARDRVNRQRQKGGARPGAANTNARFTARGVEVVREMHANGMGYGKIAAFFGVSKATVGFIIAGRSWR